MGEMPNKLLRKPPEAPKRSRAPISVKYSHWCWHCDWESDKPRAIAGREHALLTGHHTATEVTREFLYEGREDWDGKIRTT